MCVRVLSGCLILSEGNRMGDTNMLFFLCVCKQYFYLSMLKLFVILVYEHNAPTFIYFTKCCICKWSSFQCVHMLAAFCGRCVHFNVREACVHVRVCCVFTSVAMSEQCILAVIFMSDYLWMMSADCDGASKASDRGGDPTKVCMCVSVCVCSHVRHRHYSVIQHDSGCRLEGRGS